MIDLPIMGREFPSSGYKDSEYKGLVTIVCPHCGYHVTTFCKSVDKANSIICSNCGYVYKQVIRSEDVHKKFIALMSQIDDCPYSTVEYNKEENDD